jgi:uncharacterized membrane protein
VSHKYPQNLVHDYLDHVSAELRDLPEAERAEIIDDLRAHIIESTGDLATASEVDIRNLLARLGTPEDVAREARTRGSDASTQPAPRATHDHSKMPGALEVAAIILTVLFWPVGILLAWISDRWETRDKIIATAIPFASSMVFALVVVAGGLMVWGTDGGTVTTVVQDAPAIPDEPEGGTAPPPEPRSPQEISDSSETGSVVSRLVVVIGFLAGIIAGPFVSGIYLAIRLQPAARPERETGHGTHRNVAAGGSA